MTYMKVVCNNRLIPPQDNPRRFLKILNDLDGMGFRAISVYNNETKQWAPFILTEELAKLYDPYHGNMWVGEFRVKGQYIYQVILEYIYTKGPNAFRWSSVSRWKNFKHGPHKIVRRFARFRR